MNSYELIQSDDSLFGTKNSKNDQVVFNLISLIRESNHPLIYKSKDNKVIFAQTASNYPAWVWTSPDVKQEGIANLSDFIQTLCIKGEKLSIIAKPHVIRV